jgi:HEAT repeats
MRLVVFGFLAAVFVTGNEPLRAQARTGIAWDILEKGHTSRHAKERIIAVRALGQLPGNSRAVELAEELIVDGEPDVRVAAALTLGQLNAVRSIPLLREALKDKNIHVDFAASNALLSLGDSSGYAIYYEVLIGKRKSGEGPVEEQKRLIKDPKAMTLMMLGTQLPALRLTPVTGGRCFRSFRRIMRAPFALRPCRNEQKTPMLKQRPR